MVARTTAAYDWHEHEIDKPRWRAVMTLDGAQHPMPCDETEQAAQRTAAALQPPDGYLHAPYSIAIERGHWGQCTVPGTRTRDVRWCSDVPAPLAAQPDPGACLPTRAAPDDHQTAACLF